MKYSLIGWVSHSLLIFSQKFWCFDFRVNANNKYNTKPKNISYWLNVGLDRVYFFQLVWVLGPVFSPVQFGQQMFLFRSPSAQNNFLFRPVSGPIFKGGFDFSEFNLIFFGSNYSGNWDLVGFSRVCPRFLAFSLSLGYLGQKYITSGYLQFSEKWPGSVRVSKNTGIAGQNPTQPYN